MQQPRLAKMQRDAQSAPRPVPTQDELRKMIEEAAYYRAEKRGFTPGQEADDWLEAEAEILSKLRL